MLNHSKTEFITFSKKSKLEETKRNNLLIGIYKIPDVNRVKYLGIYLDCTLNFQEELKHLLRKMATVIKTIKCISRPFSEQTRLVLLNTLVISHLHYSGLLLASSKNNCFITLENQLSWAVKTCFSRKKYDSSSDLKLKHQILPIKLLSSMLTHTKEMVFIYRKKTGKSDKQFFVRLQMLGVFSGSKFSFEN